MTAGRDHAPLPAGATIGILGGVQLALCAGVPPIVVPFTVAVEAMRALAAA